MWEENQMAMYVGINSKLSGKNLLHTLIVFLRASLYKQNNNAA